MKMVFSIFLCVGMMLNTGAVNQGRATFDGRNSCVEGLNIILIDCVGRSESASPNETVTVTNNSDCVQKVTDQTDLTVQYVYLQKTESVQFPVRTGATTRSIINEPQ